MNKKRYTITLSDGTKISDLTLNGNNFVSKTKITADVFKRNLDHVLISSNDGFAEFDHMKLIQIMPFSLKENEELEWYFILSEISKEEMEKEKLRSDVDYLGMIMDVDL